MNVTYVIGMDQTKCFLENARPEPFFRYLSNARALSTFENSTVATNDQGFKGWLGTQGLQIKLAI
jgi:hypothetical protein